MDTILSDFRAEDYISALPRFGTGLDEVRAVLSKLGEPQRGMKFIHVAGTNGKGSVCALLASAFRAAGLKTGLYISPYITCFRERIQVNGEYIDESSLSRLAKKVAGTGVKLNAFAFTTIIAFLYFHERGCDVTVLETGLGGRLDATNAIDPPAAAVITGIGLDHTEILGGTLSEIAGEKCGIIKKGSPVFTSFNQPEEAMRVISRYSPTVPDRSRLSILGCTLSGSEFIYKGERFKVGLLGEHQIENAVLAIETLRGCGLSVPESAIKEGIASARFPARLEILSREPLIISDGAHNPHGAAALAREMKRFGGGALLIGMMADKDVKSVLELLLPCASRVVAVKIEGNPRSLSAESLKEKINALGYACETADGYSSALALLSGEPKIYIAGSLYLASALRPLILKKEG